MLMLSTVRIVLRRFRNAFRRISGKNFMNLTTEETTRSTIRTNAFCAFCASCGFFPLSILHCYRDRLTNNVHAPVQVGIRNDECRSKHIDVILDTAHETSFRALLMQPHTHFTRGRKLFFRRLVFDKLYAAHQSETANVADIFQACELLQSRQQFLSPPSGLLDQTFALENIDGG